MINGSTLFDGTAPAHFRYRVSPEAGECRIFLGLSSPMHDLVLARARKNTNSAAQTFRSWESTSIITMPDREGWRWLEFRLTSEAAIIEAILVFNAINLLAFMAFDETMAIYDSQSRRQLLHIWPHMSDRQHGRIVMNLWHDGRRMLATHHSFLDFKLLDRLETQLGQIVEPGRTMHRLDTWNVDHDGCIQFANQQSKLDLHPVGNRRIERVAHEISDPASTHDVATLLVACAWLGDQLEALAFIPR